MQEKIMSVLESLETDQIDYYFAPDTWRKLARCMGLPTKEFFPSRGADQEDLHEICAQCVVRDDCLTYAILVNEDFGFWGNRSERARRTIRRKLRKVRPDLLKIGSDWKRRSGKQARSKIGKAGALQEEEEPIAEGELMEHLLPKVRQLLHRLVQQNDVVNTEQFLLSLNISPEAFTQRLSLARQLKWVKLDGENLKLTQLGREQLVDCSPTVAIRIQPKQANTSQEVSMANDEYEWLNDLDIEILECLAKGEIEDGANASGVLAERIGAETGSSFSNRLKRLDDAGLIRRRVNGKRTNYLAITSEGSKALHVLGVPSSNGSKPGVEAGSVPASSEVEEWSSTLDEGFMERFDDFVGRLRNVLAENARLRARVSELVAEGDEAKVALSAATEELVMLKEELERLQPLADRYSQMQQLLSAPAE